MQTIAHLTYLVRDYDEAIAYFTRQLGFDLIEDTHLDENKRWVVVAPQGGKGASLLLAKAVTPQQESRVGDQTGGRVFLFLYSDDFWREYESMQANGVTFLESPRLEPYGTVAVFIDIYGNKWDLIALSVTLRDTSPKYDK